MEDSGVDEHFVSSAPLRPVGCVTREPQSPPPTHTLGLPYGRIRPTAPVITERQDGALSTIWRKQCVWWVCAAWPTAAPAMTSSEVSMHVEEVVVVTTPDTAVDTAVVEEVKTMLVTTELAQQGWVSKHVLASDIWTTFRAFIFLT
ncbi:hypothetical protein JZ751_017562 [Albula glossodonta]|uniref:Uncharacterized protein n=1 Tax=Albula glossodonta TaxID=121402 RepID=A0A8T2PLK0_9TELE|nr:hypothetical protein JZ751_017562 [Albula glossodonta]